jgi:hypothetical protein
MEHLECASPFNTARERSLIFALSSALLVLLQYSCLRARQRFKFPNICAELIDCVCTCNKMYMLQKLLISRKDNIMLSMTEGGAIMAWGQTSLLQIKLCTFGIETGFFQFRGRLAVFITSHGSLQ